MKITRNDLILYAVTDRRWAKGRPLWQLVEEAAGGGVTFVQLREKELEGAELEREAVQVKKVCEHAGIPFVIDDNVELALKIGADGVHVGQSDMSCGEVKELAGKDFIVGVTAKTLQQAEKAVSEGADYLGIGAAFATDSKADAKPIDHAVIRQICSMTDIPCVAIGGINKDNVEKLSETGIAGAAVISGIFAQDDIKTAAQILRERTERMISG